MAYFVAGVFGCREVQKDYIADMADWMIECIPLDGLRFYSEIVEEFLLKVFDESWSSGVKKPPKRKLSEVSVDETK